MGLETGTYINSLVATNPTGSDQKSQGDDHLRLIKSTLLATFPAVTGAVTPTHTELNYVDGVTSAIQTQIDALSTNKADKASPTFTGTVVLPSATSIGTVSATEISYVDGVTSAIQTQIDSKGAIAGQTWTGTHTFSGTVALPATTSISGVSAAEIAYLDGVTSAVQTQIDSKGAIAGQAWTGAQDFSGATLTATTQVASDSSTKVATTAHVASAVIAAATNIPGQSGNAGKFLYTDGSSASWRGVGIERSARTSNTMLGADDSGKLIDITSGTFTQTFDACATLKTGWCAYVKNSGTGTITLDPSGAETIDGAATYTLNAGSIALVQCDGSALRTVLVSVNQLVRLPIFSADADTATPASSMEDISLPTYATGLASVISNGVYGNGLYIVAESNGVSNIASSPDGITWTLRPMPTASSHCLATNGTNRFIATVSSSTTVASSTNGTTWTAATALPGTAASSSTPMFLGNDCYVIGSAANTIYKSTDNGVTWSTQTTPAAFSSRIWAIGSNLLAWATGTSAYVSTTGLTGSWTLAPLPFSAVSFFYLGIMPDGKLLLHSGNTNAPFYWTTDGVTWTAYGVTSDWGTFPWSTVSNTWANYSGTFGNCKTLYGGVYTTRTSTKSASLGGVVARSATVACVNAGSPAGSIQRAEFASLPGTALYTR